MINNLEHSADLYKKISEDVNDYQAYSVVIIFDLIIVALIAIGDSKAIIFAFSVFLINQLAWDGLIVFYSIFKGATYHLTSATKSYLELIQRGVTMLIYGGTFAFTVHHFSYLFKQQLLRQKKLNKIVMKLRSALAELSAENAKLSADNRSMKSKLAVQVGIASEGELKLIAAEKELSERYADIKNMSAELEELRSFKSAKLAELTCICGKEFDDIGAMFGHQRKCEVYKASKRADPKSTI
ncbi:MAG: hypothetical protein JXQ90_18525 [Cyclobacteriaceae bacterium]